MAEFLVDSTSRKGVLCLRLCGALSNSDMWDFVVEHNAAVDAYENAVYRVFCDIRELHPLSPEAATLFERAKSYNASRPNFRGSAVLALSSLVAMQHRRTSLASGLAATELVSDNEAACWEHLKTVQRGM